MIQIAFICLKWFGLIICALALASYMTTKTFRAEIMIPAPREDVWKVLMDGTAYPDWNPVFIKVDGIYEQGAVVVNHVMDPTEKVLTMKAKIHTLIPGKELRQTTGIPLVLTADHRWMLEAVNGGTRVVQYEIDRGAGLWFWNSDWVQPAYERVNDALKKRLMEVGESK